LEHHTDVHAAKGEERIFPSSDEITDLITDIWNDLDLKETYLYPQDVGDKVMDLFVEFKIDEVFIKFKTTEEQNTELDSIISKVYVRLREPNTRYHFTVPLTSGGCCSYDLNLSGDHEFHIAKNTDGDSEFQILTGNVTAPTDQRAIYEIARCVEEVIGVGHVLGIFIFMRPVFVPSKPLFIRIEPWYSPDLQPQIPPIVESIVHSTFAVIPLHYCPNVVDITAYKPLDLSN
jgi:hypothetical protein